jgi:Tol biopolymer transport system component
MRTLTVFLALVTLAAAAVGGCKGGGGEVSPTPTGVATRTATATGTAVPQEGLRVVYKEFGSEADTVWVATAAEPQKGTKVGAVDHATNVGISASLSPDGKSIAYLVLPTTGGDSALDAQAWLLDMDSGKKRQLTGDLDVAGTPVWSPDGSSIVVLRNGPQGQIGQAVSLLKLDVSDGSETVLMHVDDALGLYPISYSPDGSSLYFAEIILSGTHFGAVPAAGDSAQLLVQASDQVARDWHLSPDGSYVAFLAGQPTDDRIAVRAFVVELVEGAEPQPLSDLAATLDAGDHFNPVWYPDGERVTLGRTPADGASAAALVSLPGGELEEVTPGPDQGFDVPVGWSPDGDYLAVRSFEGSSAAQPGREHLVIIELGKGREMVADGGNLEFIGWLAGDSQ